nr:9948_t:CDS:2 [Entrophospora candida]
MEDQNHYSSKCVTKVREFPEVELNHNPRSVINEEPPHGRRRVKPSAEIERIRREKEANKIKEYNELVKKCFDKRDKLEYDQDAINITTMILSQNPDFYSIWNFRRTILLNGVFISCTNEEIQKHLESELGFLQEIFQLNPKSYWIFNHRRWCLETMSNPNWERELKIVVHGWDYRRYVTSKLSSTVDDSKSIIESEFDFTTVKINQNFSNYSAWHQRSKLLPLLIEERNYNSKEIKTFIDKEFDLVKSAFYTDPDDQSAWLYYWWLVGGEIKATSSFDEKIKLLEREILSIRELLEIEPNSKCK